MARYEYLSRWSRRNLCGEHDAEIPDLQGISAGSGTPAAWKPPTWDQSLSNVRKRANDVIRRERRALRAEQGFSPEAESFAAPFRPFTALDNLEPWSAPVTLAPEMDQSLQRLKREKERQVQRTGAKMKDRFSCSPEKTPTAQDLRLNQASILRDMEHENKMKRMERLLKTHFYTASKQGKPGSALDSTLDSWNGWGRERRRNRVSANLGSNNAAFSGLFQTKAEHSEIEDLIPASPRTARSVSSTAVSPKGALVGRMIDSVPQSRFVQAARRNDMDAMKSVYRKFKALSSQFDVNALGPSGESPLHAACHNAHLNVVEYLLKMGASINILTSQGHSLEHTLLNGNAAHPEHRNHRRIPRILALIQNTSIFKAALAGDTERVKLCLDTSCCDVNIQNVYGMTLLHYAYMGESIPTILFLLERSANPDIKNTLKQKAQDCSSGDFREQVGKALAEEERARRAAEIAKSRFDKDDFDDI